VSVRPLVPLLLALALGCSRRQSPPPSPRLDAAAPPADARPARVAALAAPTFKRRDGARGFALPSGCRLSLPILEAELPAHTRFTAADGAITDLALAAPEPTKRLRVERRAWVELEAGRARDLPWTVLDAPPHLAQSGEAWLAVETEPGRARLWQQGKPAGLLGTGDRLSVADAACSSGRCAVLTTLARVNLAPGATLFTGGADQPASAWRRLDFEAKAEEAFRPLAIVDLAADASRGTVALVSPESVALWDYTERAAKERGRQDAPYGVFDIVAGAAPLLVTPEVAPDAPCAEDRFPLRFAAFGKAGSRVEAQTPPRGLAARPVPGGALAVWVGPVSCRNKQRKIVYAIVVDADGTPLGSPMSVADASGFALATRGEHVSLWLRTAHGLIWLKARCSAPSAADPARRTEDAAR
jgi:hypothetical protein